MYDDKKFQELVEDSKTMKEDIKIIKQAIVVIPDINDNLKTISKSLASLDRTLGKFIDYLSSNTKYVMWGMFVIILVAMGIKEIPTIFK